MPPSLFGRRSMGQCQKGRMAGAASTGLAITAGSYPGLPSLRENVLSPRWGCEFTPLYTPGLRPGLHSGAAPRLRMVAIVPPPLRFLSSHTDSSVLGFTISRLRRWTRPQGGHVANSEPAWLSHIPTQDFSLT